MIVEHKLEKINKNLEKQKKKCENEQVKDLKIAIWLKAIKVL